MSRSAEEIARRVASEAPESDRQRKARNRERMPETAAFMDALKKAGINVRWSRFQEGEHKVEWGSRDISIRVRPNFVTIKALTDYCKRRKNGR